MNRNTREANLKVLETKLPNVKVVEPKVFKDARGFFMESYNKRVMKEHGIFSDFVQDNRSFSCKNVLRGLHYQIGKPQAKLVSVVQGKVFDVAVDIRKGSPTFGVWVGVELSAENKRQLYIPEGFAHGFLVLSEVAEYHYKCSDFYAPEEERGILWRDESLSIEWPLDGASPIMSKKDSLYRPLSDIDSCDLPDYRTC